MECDEFIERVNHTLKLYRASTIDEFRVCFGLTKDSKYHIDRWIDFAMSKGVKRFELDFRPVTFCPAIFCHIFPHERLHASSS